MTANTVSPDSATARARGRVGGLTTASRHDMHQVAARAREGMWRKFLREADPDQKLTPAAREVRARIIQRLYYAKLTLRRVETQKAKRTAPEVASEAVQAIEVHGNESDRAA